MAGRRTVRPKTHERPYHQVASACHRLGLIAQALGHSDAALGWYVEALKTAARLEDYKLCARIAHQMGRVCLRLGRRDEAAAWSALSSCMGVAPGRKPVLAKWDEPAGRVELVAMQSLWRSTTGADFPARLNRLLKGWRKDLPDHPRAAAGPARHSQTYPVQRL